MQSSYKRILSLNLLGIFCYIATVSVTQVLFNSNEVWPAAGVAFAFAMLLGFRAAPIIFLGTLFAAGQFIIQVKGDSPFTLANMSMILLTSVGDTVAILLSVWLLKKKVASTELPFFSLQGVIAFTLIGAGLSAVVAALTGVGAAMIAGYIEADEISFKLVGWIIRDFLGILIFSPPILLWWRDHSPPLRRTQSELLFVTTSLFVVHILAFGPLYPFVGPQIGQPVLLILPLAWSAIRLRLRVTTLLMAIACFSMWWGTTKGYGVFQMHGRELALSSSQSFLALISVTTLLIATLASSLRSHSRQLEIDQDRMKLALEVANVAIWDQDLETGENHSFLWLEQLGYQEEDLPNNSQTWKKLLHPDDVERVQQYHNKYYQGGRKGEYQIEYRLLHKDGNYRWILARTNDSLFDAEASQRSTGIMVEQTRWKHTEQKLKDNVYIFQSLEKLSNFIWQENTFDEHLKKMMDYVLSTLHCDRAWLLYPCDPDAPTWSVPIESTTPEYPGALKLGDDYSMVPEIASVFKENLEAKDIVVYDPDSLAKIPTTKQFSIKSQMSMVIRPRIGKPWMFGLHQCSHERIWSDRDQRLFREMGYRIADGLSSLLLLQDLEQQVANRTKQLNERNEELAAYAHTVSHDLRAPLRAMHGFAAALQEDYSEQFDETAIDYTQRIVQAASHMDGLICDLLEYSSLGRVELTPKRVNLDTIMERCLAQLETEIGQELAVIHVENPLGEIKGQKTLVEQVVSNLLSNALKFVEPGRVPEIKIGSEKKNACIILWFEDNGIGIDEEHQEKIFSVFERLHGIERYPGTGIGLAIVRRAVEKMDGEVGVTSSLGNGCRFWVSLPIAD